MKGYNRRLLDAIINDKVAEVVGIEKPKTPRVEEEHEIQKNCVRWFRLQYRQYEKMLFAIPNGGARSKATAGKLKAEGVVAGVADLCLAIGRGGYGALYIEMKQRGNFQQKNQKEWQTVCERCGNRYVVCKNIKEFMDAINEYMSLPANATLMEELKRLRQ